MAPKDKPALEAQQEVLAHGLDRLEPPPVEPLGEPLGSGPRVRRLDRYAFADEHLEAPSRAMKRVALGHVRQRSPGSATVPAAMKTSQVLVAAAALAAAISTTGSAASSVPYLRSATTARRHVVVVYSFGDLVPGRLLVATRAQTGPNGRFLQADVRFGEPLVGTRVPGGSFRMRSRHTLGPGRYYVEVSGTVVGLDCTPKHPCPTDWSNIRRVVVK